MYRAVLTLAWFVGTIYATIPLFWFIVHPFAERLRARRSRYHIIIPAWFGMMAVVYFLTWPWREAVLYHVPAAWLAAIFLFATAIFIYHRSHLDFSPVHVMGRSQHVPGRERRLITGGIRQKIRHPIYLAHLFMLLACTVGSGEVVLDGLTVFALLTGWPMVREEEAELESQFGDEYRTYKHAVPAAFIPRIFRPAKARKP